MEKGGGREKSRKSNQVNSALAESLGMETSS